MVARSTSLDPSVKSAATIARASQVAAELLAFAAVALTRLPSTIVIAIVSSLSGRDQVVWVRHPASYR